MYKISYSVKLKEILIAWISIVFIQFFLLNLEILRNMYIQHFVDILTDLRIVFKRAFCDASDNENVCACGVKRWIKRKKGRKLNRACHRYRFHTSISRTSFTDMQWSVCMCICGINLRKRYFYLVPSFPPHQGLQNFARIDVTSCFSRSIP